jgi:ABC-type branched-subunit amino acid transport system ATPase component/ABC-type branched-subunit amino acid transport system permease subunit
MATLAALPGLASVLGSSVLGWEVPGQVVVNGAIRGLGYAVIAAGIVLIYRSSGILNFAQAAFGAFGVQLFALLAVEHGINYWVSLVVGVTAGIVFALVTELIVVRRLFDASRVVLFIATVGVAQLVLTLITLVFPNVFGPIPIAFGGAWADVAVSDSIRIGPRETSVLLLVIPVLLALGVFLTRTKFGLHIRGVADSPENARLVGVSPRRVSTIVWGIAGALAAYTQIVLAPVNARTVQDLASVSSSGLLLRAIIIALAARMRSIPIVIVAGIILGAFENLVALNLNTNLGVIDLFLMVAVLVLLLVRARSTITDDEGFQVGVRVKPIPAQLRQIWWIRALPIASLGLLFLVLAAVPTLIFDKPSQVLAWSEVVLLAAVALSVSLLTGWGGQLSLGQMAFAGVGGMATIALSAGHDITIGVLGNDAFTFSAELPWLVALLAGTAVGAITAVLVGLPALRVRGLFLAATTLAFAAMAGGWLLRQDAWSGGAPTVARQPRPDLGPVDFATPRNYYLLCLGFLALAVAMVTQFRRTGAGRRIIAVRDNERMTAATTSSPTLSRLAGFAVAGGIAAMAGGLLVFLLPGFSPAGAESPFWIDASLRIVAIAIIGGIGTVAGPIVGALWVVGVPLVLPGWDAAELLTADLGLLILLLYFPGGFMQLVYNGRDALLGWAERHYADELQPATRTVARTIPVRGTRPAVADDVPWLETTGITVRFDGLVAVDDVSITVARNEVVGLIGTNGAGKTTLMNAISGFVPSSGRVTVLGTHLDGLTPARRHAAGLGRGFQDAHLFPSLTVHETILMALESRERSLTVPSLLHLPPSPGSERRKRAEAAEITSFLGLGLFADNFIADLSTGTRRIVELACLIATEARVLLLDEPTGGVAQRETEAFAPLILRVQRELGAAVLIIEHDMPLIMSISDRVYCLEAGAVIAHGSPAEVRDDPRVIASYLGTDDRAIHRSGSVAV